MNSTIGANGVAQITVFRRDARGFLQPLTLELYLEADCDDDVECWEEALAGDPWAQSEVGWMLSFGRRPFSHSFDSALQERCARYWFQQCANQGCWLGYHNLGIMLRDGRGGLPDPENAFRALQIAARNLDPLTLKRYAQCYRDGFGCAKNPEVADAIELLATFEPITG